MRNKSILLFVPNHKIMLDKDVKGNISHHIHRAVYLTPFTFFVSPLIFYCIGLYSSLFSSSFFEFFFHAFRLVLIFFPLFFFAFSTFLTQFLLTPASFIFLQNSITNNKKSHFRTKIVSVNFAYTNCSPTKRLFAFREMVKKILICAKICSKI